MNLVLREDPDSKQQHEANTTPRKTKRRQKVEAAALDSVMSPPEQAQRKGLVESKIAERAASSPSRKSKRNHPAPSPSAGSPKKRPYRRTKRPPNYCDKSTITTTTESVSQQNGFDAVLAESKDLLQAASEAQQLGRLKMAPTYMLFLHARLVGLGKRFDKARRMQLKKESAVASPVPASSPLVSSPSGKSTQSPAATPKTKAARTLARMLPSNIELDTAMMEHLAKAAAELHAARSGRQHHHPLLASPDARSFLASTANSTGITNAVTAAVSWTKSEVRIMEHGISKGKTPLQILELLPNGRTENDVKSFVRARQEKLRLSLGLDLPLSEDNNGARAATPLTRGRKPVTTAMNTVPNATCDAKTLLRGGLLESLAAKARDEKDESGK